MHEHAHEHHHGFGEHHAHDHSGHEHAHHHGHGHHHHVPSDYTAAFAIGVVLNVTFVVVEVVFGVIAGSLALLADAGHNLSDVLSLLLAWGAAALAKRQPTPRHTYGYRKATVLAALLSAAVLLVALGGITWEAINRFFDPAEVAGPLVMIVAGVGVVINGVTAALFMSGQKADINIRGAYLHMAADAGVSLGVVLAGGLIWLTGWLWLDPTLSLVIVAIIFYGTWGLLQESTAMALDAVPRSIELEQVHEYLAQQPGVRSVHDLHVWPMSTTETALTVHLVLPESEVPADPDAFLHRLAEELRDRFGIHHTTIQIERDAQACALADPQQV